MNMQRAVKRSQLQEGNRSLIRHMVSASTFLNWSSPGFVDTNSGIYGGPEEVYMSSKQYTLEFARRRSAGERMEWLAGGTR